MSRFMIFGEEEFTLGFKLAGVNDIIEVNENSAEKEVKKILDEKVEGIIVMNEEVTKYFNERTKLKLEDSVKPVCIILSKTAQQENIRRMIIKAIGIDIMAKQ